MRAAPRIAAEGSAELPSGPVVIRSTPYIHTSPTQPQDTAVQCNSTNKAGGLLRGQMFSMVSQWRRKAARSLSRILGGNFSRILRSAFVCVSGLVTQGDKV